MDGKAVPGFRTGVAPPSRRRGSSSKRNGCACYARAGHGFWLVELRASGEKAGQIGLLPREIDGRSEVEVACMVHRPFWRQGIALEAAPACRD